MDDAKKKPKGRYVKIWIPGRIRAAALGAYEGNDPYELAGAVWYLSAGLRSLAVHGYVDAEDALGTFIFLCEGAARIAKRSLETLQQETEVTHEDEEQSPQEGLCVGGQLCMLDITD